jgi:hypothetical protein
MGLCSSKGDDSDIRAHREVEKQLKEVLIFYALKQHQLISGYNRPRTDRNPRSR